MAVVLLARAKPFVRASLLALLWACTGTLGCASWFGQPNHHLLQEGVRARGVVVALKETGTTVNSRPLCAITVQVEPDGGEPYQATVRQVVAFTQIPQLQPGSPLTVRYDANDPAKIAIEAFGEPPAAPLAADEAQAMIAESQALLEALNAEGAGVPAQAVVLTFERTGVEVNGGNPLAVVTVKVLPEAAPPYDGRIVGVFGRAGLSKYAPGKEVAVRYDPAQPARIAFDLDKTRTQRSP